MRKEILSMACFATLGLALSAGQVLAQDDDDDNQPAVAAKPAAGGAAAKPSRASKNLPELIIGSADSTYAVNQKDFELIAGQGYRWKITSKGGFEYKFVTDLFRNVWVDQIVIDKLEVHMDGGPAWLEFDDAGTIQVQFHTVRPGEYTWSVPDLADKGLKGKITIK